MARKRAREADRAWKAARKLAAVEAAGLEVVAFETHLEELTSVHRECVDPVDWSALAERPAPPRPAAPGPIDRARSTKAKAALRTFKPTFLERLFGTTSRKLQLELRVSKALAAEAADDAAARERHVKEVEAWEEAMTDWRSTCDLARQVEAHDVESYAEAVRATDCLAELAATLGVEELSVAMTADRAELTLMVDEDTLVPSEQKTLSARGTVATKKLPAARRMEIYQDYVCGAALRAGREIMAVTPLEAVLVHAEAHLLDTSTGRTVPRVIVSVLCTREVFDQLNWELVDASDLVGRLQHRMKLTRGKGFVPVERLGSTAQRA